MRTKKKNEKVAYHTLHFICSLIKALRPKEKMSVSDWADKHMVLPGGSNKAGKFRSDSVPYQKEIMNAITDPAVTEVTVMSSAQIGKTTCILQFSVNDVLDFDVEIPAGTRATAGDDVYFATDESCILQAGESFVEVSATCTEEGTVGNDYVTGQINVLADLVLNISGVVNCTKSSGGQDEYDDETLRENIFMFPSTYSTAGPNAAYEFFVKAYSTDIVSVNVVQNNETAEVDIYIMLADGKIPDEKYCKAVADYIAGLENTPADDKIYVKAPEVIRYKILGKYYISESNRENETIIKESVIEAAQYFVSECHENIGVDIVPDKLIEVARVAGAKRLEITSPVFTQVTETQIAICDSVELVYGGLEDD